MIARITTAGLCLAALQGCTTDKLQTALGTPKNPTPVFTTPQPRKGKGPTQQNFIEPLYNVLLEASVRTNGTREMVDVDVTKMRRYLGAGFALSDIYCAGFFAKTDEAYRRRRFGRTLTNDVGTAVSTILGLASAGENVVTGVAAAVGLGDSAWRNYDDSFVISPDLSNVQSLVYAAQDNFRTRTLAPRAPLPGDYGTAQSIILRYSNICSFLGMKALLDQSAGEQRRQLNDRTELLNKPDEKPDAKTEDAASRSGERASVVTAATTSVPAEANGPLLPTAIPTFPANQTPASTRGDGKPQEPGQQGDPPTS